MKSLKWTAGLDLPFVSNNNPDKRLLWEGSLLIADFRSKWVSKEISESQCGLAAMAPELVESLREMVDMFDHISCGKVQDRAKGLVKKADSYKESFGR